MARAISILWLIALACTAPAHAETRACGPRIVVEYVDADPDSFTISNKSAEGWTLQVVTIDLRGSAGDLIFDTAPGGAGAGAPWPFFSTPAPQARLIEATRTPDGGRSVGLSFAGFVAGAEFTVHVDVDDQLPESPLGASHVSPHEIAGATALAGFKGPTGQPTQLSATFDRMAVADSGAGGCV